MIRRLPLFLLALLSLSLNAPLAHAQEAAKEVQPAPKFEAVDAALLKDAPLDNDFVMGKKSAPVTIVEYASLSCPHCAHFHKEVLPVLDKKYISTGKVRYILRPYPLNEPALKASELADCVGEKDGAARYYTFVRVLFDAQQQWAFDANFLKSLQTLAGVGGVNAAQFKECTTSVDRETKILTLRQQAEKELKVDHTPYFFINGHRYDDEMTAPKMTAYIDLISSGGKAAPTTKTPAAVKAEEKKE